MTNEALVRAIMLEFAERTGLTSDRAPRRYLWTDAFAVCNFLGLHEATGDASFLELARRLVDQVHDVLGRHRLDGPLRGWISGLDEAEGRAHPTRGGLRIGKPLPERGPDEPADPRLEWDRDGQYFHYLTRWMHALGRVADATGDARYHAWACELARASVAAFTRAGGRSPLAWKMSVDLTRPLVDSLGQHDPLDGLITCCALGGDEAGLGEEIRTLAQLCAGRDWFSDDPLGVGSLLCDALRADRLEATLPPRLVGALLHAAARGLDVLVAHDALGGHAEQRLAFRELGLSIGLHAVERISHERHGELLERVAKHAPLAERIERFWLVPESRAASTWRDHLDINEVMLATSLAPAGYLGD